jgi:glycosyltransferase involved in cell wall biosynthesis
LAFVGEGELSSSLRDEANRLGVANDVVLLGFRNQSELPAIYGASDVLVLASEKEPWGLVVNEALACGMAVVVSDRVGCAPDLVEPEATFPMGDVGALEKILADIASNPSRMSALKAKGRQRIERWGIPQTADGLIAAAAAACGTA